MKKIYLILFALMSVLGMSAQTWDFTAAMGDGDIAALKAATTEWTFDEAKDRYENKQTISGQVTAGGTVLELTKGLQFNAAAQKLRLDNAKRVQLAGKNITVTIPNLKKGQKVTVVCVSTGDNAVTLDAITNLTGVTGFAAADKNTTQTGSGTVAQDGNVSLACTAGSINLLSIKVEGEGGGSEGGDPTPESGDIIKNNVAKDLTENQVLLTLNDNSVKYYNSNALADIEFGEKNLVKLNTKTQSQDVYNGTVANITFAKKSEQGPSGTIENAGVEIVEAKGWLESAYLKWALLDGAESYNVYIQGGQYTEWTKLDAQLVRNYGSYGRADAVGLRAGSYDMKVVPVINGAEAADKTSQAKGMTVKNYSRAGFAFMNGYTPGAYNADGTLKANAKVFYVTKNTAKTISTTVAGAETNPCVGLQAIIAGYEKGGDTTPIAFRFIGLVTKEDLDAIGSSEEGIQIKGRRADSELNITIEGIGDDATIRGFGFLVRNSKSLEFRNIGIMRCMDDGISMDTDNSNIWVHHCDFFYGKHGSGDHDKGDGQVDVKSDSKYVTVSYNRYWDTGKTNMFGMKSESGPNYISYDHNWFDHSDSRHPRVRTMTVHVWNNYFDNVAKYGVGATTGASVFVENNYFLKTKKPILSSLQGTDGLGSGTFSGENGGMIKAYGNYFDRTAVHFSYYTQNNPSAKGYDAYETAGRNDLVPETEKTLVGGTTYNNFDTNASLMYTYTPDAADEVPSVVTGYYGAGRLNHGDFQYTFNDNIGNDDTDSAYDTVLGGLLDSYKTKLVSIFGGEDIGGGGEQGGGDQGGGDQPVQEGTILCTFDGTPSVSMFNVGSSAYGDGKITYNGTYLKKGIKLNSTGIVTFTPAKDYTMTVVLSTAKNGRDVNINGTTTTGGTENVEGSYYEISGIPVTKDTQYTITKGSAEAILMIIKLEPVE